MTNYKIQMTNKIQNPNVKYLVLLIALTLAVSSGCGRKEPSQPDDRQSADAAQKTDPVQHKVMSFNLEGLTDKGTKDWDVKGDSAESISENQIQLNNIEAKAYGEDSEAVITASSGVYDRMQNNVRLQKDVRAVIESTQEGTKNFLDLPDGAQGTAKAKKSSFESGKKTKTLITCDADVIFDYQNNRVYFNKNVKVISEDGSIDADKITVILNPTTRKIEEIIADGNVKMVRGDNVTYSEKATYNETEQMVALSGRPKLVVYQDNGFGRNFLRTDNASTRDAQSH